MKAFLRLWCLLICCVIIPQGCKDDDGGTAQPKETLLIGVLLPSTGTAASAGESAHAAILMAFEAVEAYLKSTGEDLEVALVIKDTESDPEVALQRLEELADLGINKVIGPFTSANAAAVPGLCQCQRYSPPEPCERRYLAGDSRRQSIPAGAQ